MARTELLRSRGISYREIEDSGHFLVIIDLGCKFKRPAYYDDLLTIRTTVARVTHVKIVHEYRGLRGTACSWPRAIRRWRASTARGSPRRCPRS